MSFTYQLIAWLCLCALHVCSAGICICSDHNERPIYTCDDTNAMPFSTLYYDGMGSNCLVEVSGLHAKQGWKAGLYVDKDSNYQRIVYIEEDSAVTRLPCVQSRLTDSVNGRWTTWTPWNTCPVTCGAGTISRTRSCTNPAPKYNGAQCSGPASESHSCSTNPCPINGGYTTWTTWSTCPVTCGKGTMSRTRSCTNPVPRNNGAQCLGQASETRNCNTNPCPVPTTYVPVPTIIPSTKCDSRKVINHLLFNTSASHSAARPCGQTNTNSDSEALLLEACNTPHTHYRRWSADLKVVDHCLSIPQGDPLGVFINGKIALGFYAAFWSCKTTTFEIVYQSCGAAAHKVDVKSSQFTPETFYTLKW